jgi:hypothetical protein
MNMTAEEQAIWAATYAVAFMNFFECIERDHGFDVAKERTKAGYAVAIADLAIVKLRQHRSK